MKRLIVGFILVIGTFTAIAYSSIQYTVEIQQREGYYLVYPNQRPNFEYEYLGTVDPKLIKNWKASTLTEKILKLAKKDFPNGNAVIFTEDDLWKADIVKIKE